MGTHEFDRIRNKNKIHQLAYDLYTALHSEGMSDSAIVAQCEELMNLDPTNPRNDIYSTVLKIVGSTDDNEEVTTGQLPSRSSDSE